MMARLAALLVVALLTPSAVHAACALSCAWPASLSAMAPGGAATCHDQPTATGSAAIAGSETVHCQDGIEVSAFALGSRLAPDASPFAPFAALSSAAAPSGRHPHQHRRTGPKPPLHAAAAAPLRI